MNQNFFKTTLKSKRFIDFEKKIDKGKFDNIDWFNLEEEIEQICINEDISYDKYHRVYENILEKRFKKIKKSYVIGPNEINLVFEKILNELLENFDNFMPVNDFYNANYQIESTIKNQVTKIMNYMQSYKVIEKCKKRDGNGVRYKTISSFWNEKSNYLITDIETLKELSPIIISYIKNGNIKTFNIQKLFNKFSKIIEFAIMPALGHNSIVDIEFDILYACEEKEEIEIEYEGKEIKITPTKIVIKGNEKYIQIKNGNKFDYIPLNKIQLAVEEPTIQTKDRTPSSLTMMKSFTTNLEINTIEDNKEDEIEVILECNSVVYDYFKMMPLKKMELFETEERLEEFYMNFELKPKDNKFYIVAKDKEDMVISTVLHTLPHSKIIAPMELNYKLKSMFKDYFSDLTIDLCPTPSTSPLPDETPQNKKEERPIKVNKNKTVPMKKTKDMNGYDENGNLMQL